MAEHAWPTVGQKATWIPEHAANIRSDIETLKERVSQGARAVPSKVFLQLASSITDLLDKLHDQPSLKDVMDAVSRIDSNTRTILEKTSNPAPTVVPARLEYAPQSEDVVGVSDIDYSMINLEGLDIFDIPDNSHELGGDVTFTAGASSKLVLHNNSSKEGKLTSQ